MKTLLKFVVLVLLLSSCGNDDNNSNTPDNNLFVGQWRLSSGSLVAGDDKFIYFNADNTLDVLRQTDQNFKRLYQTTYSILDNEITINNLIQGQPITFTFTFTLNDEFLTLENVFTSMAAQRTSDAPDLSAWMQRLTALDIGNAPEGDDVDMAFNFDKTQIVYGTTRDIDYISLIDPNTFEETGQITTTRSAFAVEVEKVNVSNRYIFQSDNGFNQFYAYTENDNALDHTSAELGSWISGLASVNNNKIWVASNNEANLYLYDYNSSTIEETISLDIQPSGLDYQDEFLFVSDGNTFHKCQTSPSFEVLESYYLENIYVSGIAFDGTNFWVNGYDASDASYKIVKTSLTL